MTIGRLDPFSILHVMTVDKLALDKKMWYLLLSRHK